MTFRTKPTGLLSLPGSFLALAIVLCASPGIGLEGGQGTHKIVLKWAFGVQRHSGGDKQIVSIARYSTFQKGDQFKLMVESYTSTFVYVLRTDTSGNVDLLLPTSVKAFGKPLKTSITYYVPAGSEWLTFDKESSRETFHLLASAARLKDLEVLIKTYQTADAEERQELAEKLLKEIRKVKQYNRNLKASVERPVNIGGSVRGLHPPAKSPDSELEKIAVEIRGEKFFSRAFTIDHE
jgi:hypothetical protein